MASAMARPWRRATIAAAISAGLLAVVLIDAHRNRLPMWLPEWLGRPPAEGVVEAGLAPAEWLNGFAPVQDLSVLGANGLRASISPSLSKARYQIEIAPDGLRLPGSPNIRYLIFSDNGLVQEYRPTANQDDVREMVNAFDTRASLWRGSYGFQSHGTMVVDERVSPQRTLHGRSNKRASSNPLSPMAGLGNDLHRLPLAYGPAGRVPRSPGWHINPI